jgi:ABC-type transport system substrate-binding protein
VRVRLPTVTEGEILAEKYRVDRTISRGGMGLLVAAHHLELQETVCLKLMHASAANAEDTERFLREARAVAKLRGEHVCRVMDVDRRDDGTPFIVMEMLDGVDLAQLLRARGPLLAGEAAALVEQACEGVVEAHAAGIVHRDIKPSNLFVTRRRDGTALVKVLDFGISKTAMANVTITQPEQMIGTPAYMSPEQMKSPLGVDPRTDVWGLGAVLFELVTGRLPFPGATAPEIIANVLTQPLDLEGVPPELAPIIARCLHKDRELRYASALELAAELAPIAVASSFDTPRSRRLSLPPSLAVAPTLVATQPGIRRGWRLAAIGAAIGVIAIATTALIARSHRAVADVGPRRGGTLRVAMGYDDTGFDLYSILRSRNRAALTWVVEPLLHAGEDGAVQPWVLDSTEQRDGGRTLVLHVRPGVWFHDHPCLPGGHAVTAADIAYSLRVAIESHELVLPIRADGGITVHGDDVIVALDGASSFYESALTYVFAIPKELEGCDDVRAMRRPVGTGPFEFRDAPHGTHWHLVRAPKYWRRDRYDQPLPYLDGLEIGPIRDTREALSQLGGSDLDLMMEANGQWGSIVDLRAARPTLAPQYAALGVRVATASLNNRFGLLGMFVGSHDGPLDDPRIRRALALALDRTALVALAGHPLGGPTGRFLSPQMWGYDPALHGFDYAPSEARALVRDVEREHALGPITLATAHEVAIGRGVVEQAAAVGLDVRIVAMPSSGVEAALQDEDALLGVMTSDTFDGEVPDFATLIDRGRRSAQLARLDRDLAATTGRRDRFDIYRKIERAMVADIPMIPIALGDPMDLRDDQVFLVGRRVHFGDEVTGFAGAEAVVTAWFDRAGNESATPEQ